MDKSVSRLPSYDASTLKDPSSDFHRLSRRIFRRSVALILGGGGARGLAHVGFIKAMEERGIPVDIIGGSSMGACVGGVLARELTATSTYNCIKAFSSNLRIRHFLPDITFPYLAKTTGSFFQRQLRDLFGNATFDDTWLEYYCAVTNVTKDCISQTVHRGNLSNSIAASMSYLGAVPPTCMNGDLWIDSCYSENLPARHARELGAETIFVVDVSRLEPLPLYRYGSSISGWNILISKMKNLLPARLHVPVSIPPSSSAISERLTLGTSTRESEAVKNMKGCYYIKLPLHGYTTKNFQKFEELVQQGYQGGKAWFDEQEALHNLPTLAVPHRIISGSELIQNAALDPRSSQASAEAQTL
jgi:lysophospholipid hydrolase